MLKIEYDFFKLILLKILAPPPFLKTYFNIFLYLYEIVVIYTNLFYFI